MPTVVVYGGLIHVRYYTRARAKSSRVEPSRSTTAAADRNEYK